MVAFKYGKQEQDRTCANCRHCDNLGYIAICTEPLLTGDHKLIVMNMGSSCLKWEKK